ncbi:unnamed protein product [Lampetra planeri]
MKVKVHVEYCFEVKVNGKLVYSKLELGGLPELDDVSSLPGTDSTPVTTTLPLLLLSPPSLATGAITLLSCPQQPGQVTLLREVIAAIRCAVQGEDVQKISRSQRQCSIV